MSAAERRRISSGSPLEATIDAADAADVSAAHGQAFADVRSAATMVVGAGLLDPRWRVEIEAEAIVDVVPPTLPVL